MDVSGQSALFDAFLFFVVALAMSAAVLTVASSTASEDEAASRERALAYAEDVRAALMRTTLEDPWYLDRIGYRVDLGQGVTVERFLVDEGALLASGLADSNFAAANDAIFRILGDLLRPPFDGGVEVSSGPPANSLWIGAGAPPPADRFTASWRYAVGGSVVEVAVHLWLE